MKREQYSSELAQAYEVCPAADQWLQSSSLWPLLEHIPRIELRRLTSGEETSKVAIPACLLQGTVHVAEVYPSAKFIALCGAMKATRAAREGVKFVSEALDKSRCYDLLDPKFGSTQANWINAIWYLETPPMFNPAYPALNLKVRDPSPLGPEHRIGIAVRERDLGFPWEWPLNGVGFARAVNTAECAEFEAWGTRPHMSRICLAELGSGFCEGSIQNGLTFRDAGWRKPIARCQKCGTIYRHRVVRNAGGNWIGKHALWLVPSWYRQFLPLEQAAAC